MLLGMVINTDKFEIHIKKQMMEGYKLTVYKIVSDMKELYEEHTLKCYETARVYVEEKFLKSSVV